MEKDIGEWDDIYRNARRSEKLRFEANLRDEGELERTGQPICIYEIYNGAGGWPFLHHGSLYRGLSLVSYSQLGWCIFTCSGFYRLLCKKNYVILMEQVSPIFLCFHDFILRFLP